MKSILVLLLRNFKEVGSRSGRLRELSFAGRHLLSLGVLRVHVPYSTDITGCILGDVIRKWDQLWQKGFSLGFPTVLVHLLK